MSVENDISQSAVTANMEIQGLKVFLPILEEFKLFQGFMRQNSIWNTKKKSYWEHEKAILAWAYSKKHQHLGHPINIGKIVTVYGLDKSKCGLNVENSDKLVQSMKKSGKEDLIRPLLSNLVHKGLAYVLEYEGESPYIKSVMISKEGLIVGKLVVFEQKGKLFKYRFIKFILWLIIGFAIAWALVKGVNSMLSACSFLEQVLQSDNMLNYWILRLILF
jgi:hypothetical protein